MKERASYTKEFKLEALRLMRESERPVSEIARELGIRRNQLYKWQEEFKGKGTAAFAGQGRPKKADQSELSRLQQENKRLQEENEILKKAAVFFAKK
jgi:transposase